MGPLLLVSLFLSLAGTSLAADCKFSTVGSPYSTCYDIATAAKITTAQLTSFNPGLNCNTIVPGQRLCISSGTLPDTTPKPNPDGSCATYTPVAGDYCAIIATKYGITTDKIEQFNKNTYKWKGCAALAVGMPICVSTGTPPPIPVNPNLQCGPESPKNATCPLKACCSAFGFCGLTDEFCKPAANGDPCISNCGQPTIKTCGGGQMTRKVGYYAGWAARRKCSAFRPKDIDLEGFTDVIFSFALITQDLGLGLDVADAAALEELVELKYNYPNMKVRLAVGGWTFSTADPTKSLFTVMISSAANRKKFIDSAKAFIKNFNLDGIDVDMEYPSAIERSAPSTDTPNLTALFKEMRASMGSDAIISVAAPAGYWFLKGFEIDKIMQDISYINMMSYDYHGPWDTAVPGEDSTAKPHTSVKDIEDSVKLYTRAGVDLSKVNLGLAWYGRTYNVGSCKGMGCKMTGGGAPGSCTGESGVVSQLEVWNDNPKPTLDTNSQTYWYNKGNDFITYDDQTTWAYKTDYAAKHCFGGTFVWSLDQVRPSTKPPPPPPVDVDCGGITLDSSTINDCNTLVSKMRDDDTFHMNSTTCPGVIGIKPTCEGNCCLFLTFDDFKDAKIRAKEVKTAASAIMSECYSGKKRNLEKRILPAVLAIAAAWNMVAVAQIFGVVVGALAGALAAIFKLVFNDDDERRAFVLKTLDEAAKAAPEYNIIIAHTEHTYEFDDLHHHEHVEFDRPDPWGTFGYEIYHARTGNFELKGDGDYINWAWSGYITPDKDNSKKLTLYAPGVKYGAASINGQYTAPNGATTKLSMGIGLGNSSGCITCFV